MIFSKNCWQKLGRFTLPAKRPGWFHSHFGATYAEVSSVSSEIKLFITARDIQNRSHIGAAYLDLRQPTKIRHIDAKPVLSPGLLGAFDENGVSYPCLVARGEWKYLYYTGWMPSVLTPFQNQIGLALAQKNKPFVRFSKAPLLERTNDDYLCQASSWALYEKGLWRLWYTSWLRWQKTKQGTKHFYCVKYAESLDGKNWKRHNKIAIPLRSKGEYAVARPCVLKFKNLYHMWYCARGKEYQIGYAYSKDGVSWKRREDLTRLSLSQSGWDSKSMAYPNVFRAQNKLWMIYSGNDYGRAGAGIAKLEI